MIHQKCIAGFIAAFVLGSIIGWFLADQSNIPLRNNTNISTTALDLKSLFRQLWTEHVVWTRSYIVAVANNSKETGKTAARLLRNQEDIGNALKAFYGLEAGDRIGKLLLKDHVLIAADILNAVQTNNVKAIESLDKRWQLNAEELAHYLSGLNPTWNEAILKQGLSQHLEHTKQEAIAHLSGDFEQSIIGYDNAAGQILSFADYLAQGIVLQFPDKF